MHKPIAILTTIISLTFAVAATAQESKRVDALAKRLAQGDGSAAVQIVKYGKVAVPPLVDILQSNAKSMVRGHAAHALGRIGPDAKAAVPALAAALLEVDEQGEDRGVAEEVSVALGRIGLAAADVLVKTLQHKNPQVRALAAGALKQINPLPKSAAPAVIAAFKRSTASTHLETLYYIDLIGTLGSAAKEAIPDLTEYAKKSLKTNLNSNPRYISARSVGVHTLHAVAKMGPAAEKALPFVMEVLQSKNSGVAMRIQAIDVLSSLGAAAAKASPVILDLMKSGDGPPRMVLLKCLAKIGFSGDATMQKALYAAMLDKNAETRIYAARIMGQKKPDDLTVVSVLLESLRHRDADVRLLAAQTLAVVRPSDESAEELLREALNDTDARVRQAAQASLKKYKK